VQENRTLIMAVVAVVVIAALAVGAFLWLRSPAEPEATQPPPVSAESIVDIIWQWTELIETEPAAQSVVPDPENYTLVFRPDGQYQVKADCNLGSGSYTVDGNSLTLGVMAMTMAECGPESLYDQYVALLGNVDSFGMDGDRLVLYLKDEAGRMVFANGGPAEPMPTPPPDATPPTGQPPEPVISYPAYGLVGEEVTFDGSESRPGSSLIASYQWDFGDGNSGDGATVTHIYNTPGTFQVTLLVTGEDGLSSVGGPVEITITEAETPTPETPPTGTPETTPTEAPEPTPTGTPEPTPTEAPEPTPTEEPEPTPTTSPGAGLVGPTWQWTELIEESPPAQSVIPNPEDYTLEFDEDGTFDFQADCNSGSGSYTVQGDGLVLVLGAVTSVECGEESLSDQYMALLGSVEAYEFEGVRLLLYLQNDAGHMVFVPQSRAAEAGDHGIASWDERSGPVPARRAGTISIVVSLATGNPMELSFFGTYARCRGCWFSTGARCRAKDLDEQ
jgi:heat shock protein HslJ